MYAQDAINLQAKSRLVIALTVFEFSAANIEALC